MIEIQDLTKMIGGETILNHINLTVNKGEVLGFLGPNGAGKTTTMKIISGFWLPTSGSVKVAGVDVLENSIEARRKIGYLPENVPTYDDMLVFEYLKTVAEIRGIPKDKAKNRLKEVAEMCGLTKVIRRPIDELSKGYRQRVGLAQAIIHDPEVLVLDEPTTGLDPNQIVEIRDLIKRIGREKTVIFSTHILGEVSATCDRVIIINNGNIIKEGSHQDITREASAKQIIYIKIRGYKEEVLNKLKSVDNIVNVEFKDSESERVNGFEIEPKDGSDIREYLSAFIVNSGWGVLELARKENTLEDVFRELTK
jgi:ABC-2 type transport system ATP-binding protein